MNRERAFIDLGSIRVQFLRNVRFSFANQEYGIGHQLGLTPMGALVLAKNRKCDIWSGQRPPASNVLWLVCDTDDVTATILVVAQNLTRR